ncbi:hypothetical protein NDU88_002771 [Pleurodeles waltl]|uniref:CCHC-type domain-containing protein n=1 Tax=Pleurodeles waltl TaxID=8319 RepID=A0AAV7PG93_PLEWA|nr:hypothetical protein NDU88_002771 [Pleurodeles waltl]
MGGNSCGRETNGLSLSQLAIGVQNRVTGANSYVLCELEFRRTSRKTLSAAVHVSVTSLEPRLDRLVTEKDRARFSSSKPIDEVLQYAKYCSDEFELKQEKLKEKVMVMQIKAAQTGVQGNFVQQTPHQQGNIVFQPLMRGRGRGGNVNRGPDLNIVVVQNDVLGMKNLLPCHICGAVGHWKQECPMMVYEGVFSKVITSIYSKM